MISRPQSWYPFLILLPKVRILLDRPISITSQNGCLMRSYLQTPSTTWYYKGLILSIFSNLKVFSVRLHLFISVYFPFESPKRLWDWPYVSRNQMLELKLRRIIPREFRFPSTAWWLLVSCTSRNKSFSTKNHIHLHVISYTVYVNFLF